MGKPLKIEVDGRVMSLKDAVRELVSRGLDNGAIYLRLGAFTSRKNLSVQASIARREVKSGSRRGRKYFEVSDATKSVFEREAAARKVSTAKLMGTALQIIAADDLFDAVLGDALPKKKEERA